MAERNDRPKAYPPQTTGQTDEAVIFEVPALEAHLRPLFEAGGSLDYEISWYVEEAPAKEWDLASSLTAGPSRLLVFCVDVPDDRFAVALGPRLWPILEAIAATDAIGLTYAIGADRSTPGVLLLRNASDGLAEARARLEAEG